MVESLQKVEQKTKLSQVVGVGIVFAVGAASVAGFLFFGSQLKKDQGSTSVTVSTTTTESAPVDLSAQESVKPGLNPTEYAAAVAAATAPSTATDVAITITSPTEGAVVTGTSPISATVDDPTQKVKGVRFETFNDRYGYHFIWGLDGTIPYGFTPNLGLYPSGEYRHVAIAKDQFGNTLAAKDVMVTFAHNCYYLAYQDMTLAAPTETVKAGTSFTLTGSVKNNIRGNCQNIYSLDTADAAGADSLLPSGWTATLEPASLNLGIRETKEFSMTISVPGETGSGVYQVGARSGRQNTGFIVTKSVPVTVTASESGGGGREPIVIE